jgi:c-di-GMP-binding flagellar brake protein YcgR
MSKTLFHPGLPLLLQLPKLEDRVHIQVIGWQAGQFLLTNLPYINERPIKLKSDENCIIRFLKGDDAYGFQTSVISVQFFPAPLIFFKDPASVDKMPFRKSKRFRLSIEAKILNPSTIEKLDVTILDISATGCKLSLPNRPDYGFEIGGMFYLTFNILEKAMQADCILRNISEAGDSLLLGMQFSNISIATKNLIEAFIDMISKVPDAQ